MRRAVGVKQKSWQHRRRSWVGLSPSRICWITFFFVHSRSGLSPFEYLVEKPLLCHRLQKVRRQFANSLIPNGCLKREVPGHGWGKRQWSVLLFAVVPHANGERRGAGRSRLRDRGWLFQLHRPSSRSPCSQTDPQPRAGDLEGAHGDSNLCRNFLAARATCKEVPDLLYALWRKLAWPPAKSRGCPLLQFSIAHGYCLSGYKLCFVKARRWPQSLASPSALQQLVGPRACCP
jgi:hypothetical protein